MPLLNAALRDLSDDALELYETKAAEYEYQAEMSREIAETLALQDALSYERDRASRTKNDQVHRAIDN